VKKQLLRVLAVILMVILLLTCVTSAAYAWWWWWPPIPPSPPPDITEDFEWGYDTCSLEDCSANWEVVGPYTGESWAEIDDDVRHGDTGRSAQFYRDGSKNVYAYYETDTSELSDICFYVKRASTEVYVDFRCGDGDHCIWVRIMSDGRLRWYDYPQWHTVDVDDLDNLDKWYKIEFKNIDWNGNPDDTFDIYVDDDLEEEGAIMHLHGGFDEGFYFENLSPSSGSFWIDDIVCSLEQ